MCLLPDWKSCEQNFPQPFLGPNTQCRAQLSVQAIHVWAKDGVMRDGAPQGRTIPEVAPIEGALRQGLPAVVGEGCLLHSCLHLRWTKGFPPPSLRCRGGCRQFPVSHSPFPPLPPGYRRRDGIFLYFFLIGESASTPQLKKPKMWVPPATQAGGKGL